MYCLLIFASTFCFSFFVADKNEPRPPRKAYGRLSVESDDNYNLSSTHKRTINNPFDDLDNFDMLDDTAKPSMDDNYNNGVGGGGGGGDNDSDLELDGSSKTNSSHNNNNSNNNKNNNSNDRRLNELTINRLQAMAISDDDDYGNLITKIFPFILFVYYCLSAGLSVLTLCFESKYYTCNSFFLLPETMGNRDKKIR